MSKFKALLLAAAVTAGVPAIASAQDRGHDDQQQGEHRDHGDHGQGQRPGGEGQRPPEQRPDQGNFQRGGNPGQRAQMDQSRAQADQARAQADQARAQQQQQQRPADQGRQQFDRPRDFNPGDRGNVRPDQGRPDQARPDRGNPDWRQGSDVRRDEFRRPDGGPGRAPGPDYRPGFDRGGQRSDFRPDPRQFNRDWRQDRRFDWRGFRDQHREVFRAPRYIAPRNWGWGYRPFGIGAVLPGLFFDQQYWIADPWEYRLPPAYGPYRWVRYFNDVLLIDLRSGQVVDSIPNFFW